MRGIGEVEWPHVGSIHRHILCAVGKKYDLNMEDVREDKEYGIIDEGVGEIYGEYWTDWDILREK